MKTHSRIITLFTALALISTLLPARAKDSTQPVKKPLVQIAVLLDTSNSMDGLIEQAKSQLWKICNEFIKAKQNGVTPEVHVALYEYGKSSLPGNEGFIRQIQPFTQDLDKLSEDLFALRTNGGEEYCGWVIKRAVEELAWDASPDVYKAIFIAGNEPFTQGKVDYAVACKAAITKGIIVNTIHCGADAIGRNTKWKDGAELADGKYMVIDQNRAVVSIAAPQDAEIARLGVELNKTYVAFGRGGGGGSARQAQQDANVASLAPASGAAVQRAITKSSANYNNSSWDLVDAAKDKNFSVSSVKREELPAEMQKLNETERAAYIEKKSKERTDLQAQINQLNAEREKYIATQMKTQSGSGTLDSAIIGAIREQGQKRSLKFE
jgi:hypothetical protein